MRAKIVKKKLEKIPSNVKKKLEKIYYDPKHPASFSTVDKLWLALEKKIPKKTVIEWLISQDTYTRHKPRRVHFPRNCYIITNIAELYEADLAIFPDEYAKHNDGFKYILVVIDCFSKFMFVEPLKRRTTEAIIVAFKKILDRTGVKCDRLQSDHGGEFDSHKFRALMKENGIIFNTTSNPDTKASIVERSLRTIKGKIYKYLTYANTFRYIDVLNDIVSAYNNTYHSTIKMKPSEVNDKNILQVYRNIRESQLKRLKNNVKKKKPKFTCGDYVRITKSKHIFEKSFTCNFTEEVFRIKSVATRTPTVYYLEDLGGEEITGTFYEPELQKVLYDEGAAKAIEKIIKQSRQGKTVQYFVKFRGYPDKFNCWVNSSAITPI